MNSNSVTPGTMDMGDIVAGAFDIYRRRPLTWLALTIIGFVVILAANLAFADDLDLGNNPSDEQVRQSLPAAGGFTLGTVLGDLFTHVALVGGAATVLAGGPLTVGGAYMVGLRRILPVLAASLLTGVVALALCITILLIPLAIFFAVAWSLAAQVIVAEREGPLRSLGRSRQIVRGQWWRTLGITLAIALLGFLPGFLIGRLTGSGAGWLPALGAAAGGSLVAPFIALAQTLLYADLRARKGERPFQPRAEAIA